MFACFLWMIKLLQQVLRFLCRPFLALEALTLLYKATRGMGMGWNGRVIKIVSWWWVGGRWWCLSNDFGIVLRSYHDSSDHFILFQDLAVRISLCTTRLVEATILGISRKPALQEISLHRMSIFAWSCHQRGRFQRSKLSAVDTQLESLPKYHTRLRTADEVGIRIEAWFTPIDAKLIKFGWHVLRILSITNLFASSCCFAARVNGIKVRVPTGEPETSTVPVSEGVEGESSKHVVLFNL